MAGDKKTHTYQQQLIPLETKPWKETKGCLFNYIK